MGASRPRGPGEAGDEEAFDALARLVGDRCMAIASRILRDADRAEDAVQATLIVAWRELRTLRDPDRFEPWLHRILTNECYAEARRRTRWSAQIRILPVENAPEASGILTVNDRDQLERAFRRLTLEQRAVLVFHHYLGCRCLRWRIVLASPAERQSPASITRRIGFAYDFEQATQIRVPPTSLASTSRDSVRAVGRGDSGSERRAAVPGRGGRWTMPPTR